jgi:hypothetical protein
MKSLLPSASLFLAAVLAAQPAAAQHINLKTLPIPAGEQFELLPSRTLGMASVRIAVDDPWADPFINPALGARTERLQIMALPTFYGEASNQVGGRSFPLAVLVPGSRLFGSAAVALQQVTGPRRFNWWPMPGNQLPVIRDNSTSNSYVTANLGTRLNGGRTSIGVGAYHADLEGVDAVNLLYARSFAIQQQGSLTEFRAGLAHDLGEERRMDAVVARASLDMTHDVWYVDWTWTPEAPPVHRTWQEVNRDRTITWSAAFRYLHPVQEDVRVGVILAGSTKAHPHIPNYDVVNIPRDPGNSAAGNIGVGLSNTRGAGTFGLEVVFEPARSHTWAFADTVIAVPGGFLQAGEKTVDNQFRYRNWHMAFGVDREAGLVGFQLGMRLRHIRYSLDQQNFLTDRRRQTRESWMEWSPAWGAALNFDEFQIRYSGRFTARGWPDTGFVVMDRGVAMPGGIDFIVAPTEPVNFPDFRVTLHRLMVAVPFGR